MRMHRSFLVSSMLAAVACGGSGDPALEAETVRTTTAEDTAVEVDLAWDQAAAALTWRLARGAPRGSVEALGGGRFRYLPRLDFVGTDGFRVEATGGDAPRGFEVVVTVTPVNDAPRVAFVARRPGAPARAAAAMPLAISDPDSPGPYEVDVAQLSGPSLANLRIADGALQFEAPDVARVERATVRFATRDGAGASGLVDATLGVWPVSASGKLHTLQGSPDDPGYHMVLNGDGYAAADRTKLFADADVILDAVLSRERIGIVNAAWNFHLLVTESVESGIDVVFEGILRDTAFDAVIGCAGVRRQLCASYSKQVAAATAELPAWDGLMLVANTPHYGGIGSGAAATTASPDMGTTIVHELGHTFAGLGDEYAMLPEPTTPPPPEWADQWPNISLTNDPASVKWARWLDVPGVGLYEGGAYRQTLVWRPTENSFMRSNPRPVDVVSAEAWALALYAKVGAVTSATPPFGPLSVGGPVVLRITTPHAGNAQSVRWFVDGVEDIAAAGSRELLCCTPAAGVRTVTVSVEDATGLVRVPDGPHRFEGAWTVAFP